MTPKKQKAHLLIFSWKPTRDHPKLPNCHQMEFFVSLFLPSFRKVGPFKWPPQRWHLHFQYSTINFDANDQKMEHIQKQKYICKYSTTKSGTRDFSARFPWFFSLDWESKIRRKFNKWKIAHFWPTNKIQIQIQHNTIQHNTNWKRSKFHGLPKYTEMLIMQPTSVPPDDVHHQVFSACDLDSGGSHRDGPSLVDLPSHGTQPSLVGDDGPRRPHHGPNAYCNRDIARMGSKPMSPFGVLFGRGTALGCCLVMPEGAKCLARQP